MPKRVIEGVKMLLDGDDERVATVLRRTDDAMILAISPLIDIADVREDEES